MAAIGILSFVLVSISIALFFKEGKSQKVGSYEGGLCVQLIRPAGFPCFEHTVQTKDGYLLSVQHIPSSTGELLPGAGPPVFLQHGLFMGGDVWFSNSVDESLGFILAKHGFDVWVGNIRGTKWSQGHVSLSEKQKAFWDWSWEELAHNDLADMIRYVHLMTSSKVYFAGHSQGTIIALAAFMRQEVADMIEAAALLCPISYLGHIKSRLVLRAVELHLDQVLSAMGIHQLNFRSDIGVDIINSVCDHHTDCGNLLAAVTGENCCFNSSRVNSYLQFEPQPSSLKNLIHLFQMIRRGKFARFDYGFLGNFKRYGNLKPPVYDLSRIPKSLPLWMAYGGNDALADDVDIKQTLQELNSEPELLYLASYGHVDFILSATAKSDVYVNLIQFFTSKGAKKSPCIDFS